MHYDVNMSAYQQTWPWGDVVNAVETTSGALRREIQRGKVELEHASEQRTQATLGDIARLRISRFLSDAGIEAGRDKKRSFGLAKLFIADAYGHLLSGKTAFTVTAGEQQQFVYPIFNRKTRTVGPIIRLDPQATDAEKQAKLRELAQQAARPENLIVPIHRLVLDAWYSLPDLPGDVAAWMRASSHKLDAAFGG